MLVGSHAVGINDTEVPVCTHYPLPSSVTSHSQRWEAVVGKVDLGL